MRTIRGAENVVRVADVGYPVAHGLVDRFLKRLLAGFHADDCCAHEPHAKHIQRLALHVVRAHVDDTLQTKFRARRRGRHAMLARTGLGDDTFLAHAFRENRLRKCIVDLVRARVQQILALQINLRAAAKFSEPLCKIKLGWPARKFLQMMAQFLLEFRIVARHLIGGGQLLQRGHERLRDKHPTIGAEMPRRIGLVETRGLSGGGSGG